jgi:hypothetical protein
MWDVNDPDPPKCARKVDRRAIPDRGITTAVRRVDESRPLAADELRVGIERRRPATAVAPQPDAWVDDTGRVKFRLGLEPFPGMKLYMVPGQVAT